ncbi:MAG: hypothetical protein DME25_18875, partial [Verrucomicrobia bacterium]
MLTVVISPYGTATFAEGGGHFWVYLQYVLALRQLGCEVYWLEGFRTNGPTKQEAAGLAKFRARMKEYGLEEKLILYAMNSQTPSSGAPR